MDRSHPLARNLRFWFTLNYVCYVNVKKKKEKKMASGCSQEPGKVFIDKDLSLANNIYVYVQVFKL